MRPVRLRFVSPFVLLLALVPTTSLAQSFCDFAPRVTTAGIRAAVGVSAMVEVSVVDPNGDGILSLTANTTGLPAGNNAVFTVNSSNTSGTLTWTPQTGQNGAYSVSFTASNSLSTTASASIQVIDTGGAPFVQCPGSLTTGEFRPLTFNVLAGDPDGESIVSLTAAPLPSGATFTVNATNTAGTFAWTPNFTQAGSFTINFTASSSTSATYTTFITVTQVDRAPVVITPPSATGSIGAPLNLCVQAADPDGDAITALTASSLPPGATFTSSPSHLAGTMSWTPAAGQAGNYTVTFFASNSLSGSAQVAVTIEGAGDTAPLVNVQAAATFLIGFPSSLNVTASDPNGDPITSLTASNLPPGASFLPNFNNTQGTLSWTPTTGQGGTYFVLFTATANGLTGSATTTINVVGDELPAAVFTTGGNSSIKLNSGKPRWCVHVEPVGGNFNISDVVPNSIVLLSVGTGSVSQISAIQGKGIVAGDANNDNVADFEACFSKEDLRLLFRNVTSKQSIGVNVRGTLTNGSRFQGSVGVEVSAGGGSNVARLTPNPPDPASTLRFATSLPGPIRARVFDTRGRLVRTLDSAGDWNAGDHAIHFDGRSDNGRPLPSGIYLFRVETADGELTTKAAILH